MKQASRRQGYHTFSGGTAAIWVNVGEKVAWKSARGLVLLCNALEQLELERQHDGDYVVVANGRPTAHQPGPTRDRVEPDSRGTGNVMVG